MMRYHFPFDGKRFIGDNRTKVFHDCLNEPHLIGRGGCGIDRIPYEEVRTYDPDSAAEACRRGFVQCPFCRSGEKDLYR